MMAKVIRKENDPKTHMTLIEYCYEERLADLIVRVYRWESRNNEISYGWEISKEYEKVTLREVWSIRGEKTFQAAYGVLQLNLLDRLDKNPFYV